VDLAGRVRFGPDVEWVDVEDYHPSEDRVERFVAAVRRYWPGLPDGTLIPSYAGIRPKVVGPGESSADFSVLGPRDHGVEGLTLFLGIESPGITAALALAEL
jgi:L-2-hydroxyglutarate oxidase LhgO